MKPEIVSKNILDMTYQKQLATATTAIIVGLTYLIGVTIAFLSNQVNISSLKSFAVFVFISNGILGGSLIFFISAGINMKKTLEKISLLSF